jgi:hypothetical protein
LTRAGPDIVKEFSVNEQMTEQTAAFNTDAIFENTDDTVSHEIMLIADPSLGTRKANIKQNSATNGSDSTD